MVTNTAVHGLPSSVHAVPLAFFASAGHAAYVPSQASATSQSPAAARHSMPTLPAACWQVVLVPSQVSVVHGLPSSVHAVPLCFVASAGQAAFVPSQASATSQSPTAARSEEHTSELQSHSDLVCRLLLEKKKKEIKNREGETK